MQEFESNERKLGLVMAFKLLLENGNMKQYCPYYSVPNCDGGNAIRIIPTYETKCGLKWEKRPGLHDECNHLDCAIGVAEWSASASSGIIGAISCIALAVISFSMAGEGFWGGILGTFSIIFFMAIGLVVTSNTIKNSREKGELREFRDHGTVNGIRAREL